MHALHHLHLYDLPLALSLSLCLLSLPRHRPSQGCHNVTEAVFAPCFSRYFLMRAADALSEPIMFVGLRYKRYRYPIARPSPSLKRLRSRAKRQPPARPDIGPILRLQSAGRIVLYHSLVRRPFKSIFKYTTTMLSPCGSFRKYLILFSSKKFSLSFSQKYRFVPEFVLPIFPPLGQKDVRYVKINTNVFLRRSLLLIFKKITVL